jgi:two-component system chemotaxis response regulator CheY
MPLQIQDLTVLLIEPSNTQSKILKKVLNEEGITKLDILTSGQEAIQYLQSSQPDLVISAMYFSDMTAIELLLQIRNEPLSQETNFMLISSETNFAKIDPIKQSGVLAVLPKPFDRRDFRTALNAARDTLEVSHLTLENLDLDNLRGLIVDDSKTARRHITKLLTSCGIDHCLHADNGREAIDLLHQEHIDFIITDYNMPEMNGQELAEYLSKSEFSYLPVLMVTSEADNSRLSAVRQAGVCALFDKTIDPASLKNALNNVLNE